MSGGAPAPRGGGPGGDGHAHFIVLLALLCSLFVLQPIADLRLAGVSLGAVLIVLVLGGAVAAVKHYPRARLLAGALAVLGIVTAVLRQDAAPDSAVHLVCDGCLVALFAIVCSLIAAELFTARRVGLGSVAAALCVYLLIGLAFAFLFDALEQVEPGSFRGLVARDGQGTGVRGLAGRDLGGIMYYSFVTLTTVGYGDITPVGATARNFAMFEALLGQVVLVVLVARLVGLQVAAAGDGGPGAGRGGGSAPRDDG